MRIRQIFLPAIFLFSLVACNNSPKDKPHLDAGTGLFQTTDDDSSMNKAIRTARNTFGDFREAFNSGKYDPSTFSVKVSFPFDGGDEHIWADSIYIDTAGAMHAVISNVPEQAIAVKLNDHIVVDTARLSDWSFTDKGILKGGYTIRVERNAMTPQERAQLDAQLPYKIE